jgi:hypothetical protein
LYKDDNCKACHSDMKGFATTSPTVGAFHGLATHGTMACTFCHVATEVNLGGWGADSGATLRKQVDTVKICAGCHKNYPAKLP